MSSRRQIGRTLLGISVLAALAVAGCRQGARDGDGSAASVRLINAVPDAGGLDVSADGKRVWKRAPFRSSTGYEAIAPGTYPVEVDADETGTTLRNETLSFEKQQSYTLLVLGQAGSGGAPVRMQVLPDENPGLPAGKARVRLINASPGAPSVDLVVNTIVGVQSIGYGHRSAPLLLAGGHYDLQLAASDTARMLVGPVSLELKPGQSYTLIAMGQVSRQSLTLEAYPDR